jgi:hypothetical protein
VLPTSLVRTGTGPSGHPMQTASDCRVTSPIASLPPRYKPLQAPICPGDPTPTAAPASRTPTAVGSTSPITKTATGTVGRRHFGSLVHGTVIDASSILSGTARNCSGGRRGRGRRLSHRRSVRRPGVPVHPDRARGARSRRPQGDFGEPVEHRHRDSAGRLAPSQSAPSSSLSATRPARSRASHSTRHVHGSRCRRSAESTALATASRSRLADHSEARLATSEWPSKDCGQPSDVRRVQAAVDWCVHASRSSTGSVLMVRSIGSRQHLMEAC